MKIDKEISDELRKLKKCYRKIWDNFDKIFKKL